jgi:hypothetical protein
MTSLEDVREEIRLKLTGDLLEIELEDDTIDQIIMSAIRELQRYITVTRLITVPFERCIDLCQYDNINNVVAIYRTNELGGTTTGDSASYDPMQVAQWQLIAGMGNLTHFQDAVYNYSSWTTLQQLRNTTSTDLAFKYDKYSKKLYINTSVGTPENITIEYIPVIKQVEDIKSEYWEDMLIRLSLALTKVTVGRIRTRYTQSNALWTQDGETILQEGQEELKELRQMMLDNSDLFYPID